MNENKENSRQKILDIAIELFSKSGFSNVSIREIAQSAGIKSASLYYYFPNKQAIYLDAIEHAFSNKAAIFNEVLNSELTALERLEQFIYQFTQLMSQDEQFRRLLQREILDGDETRLKYIAEKIFKELFGAFSQLIEEVAPDSDPHMLNMSIVSLILHHLETAPIRKFLPGYRPEHEQSEYIAHHVFTLISHGIHHNE